LITDVDGAILVSLARQAVTTYVRDGIIIEPSSQLGIESGVFVTLNYLTRKKEEHLRGCIGFPLPYKDLGDSVIEAAIAAATADPRFAPVDLPELPNVIFEVSVLTPPSELQGSQTAIRDLIKIGRDGLILRWSGGSGLLLPQVAVELNWTVEEFLVNLCYKAGTTADALNDPTSKLYSFQALVFKELEPSGKVARVEY
jgi:uncharacterized protein (TIGR00296 family)